MNRREVLKGSGATAMILAGLALPLNAARAQPQLRRMPVRALPERSVPARQSGTYSPELGGRVNGSYQLRATSVMHRTVM